MRARYDPMQFIDLGRRFMRTLPTERHRTVFELLMHAQRLKARSDLALMTPEQSKRYGQVLADLEDLLPQIENPKSWLDRLKERM